MSEMRDTMNEELKEMIRTLERANSALARVFNVEEGENCAGCGDPYEGEGNCPDCRCGENCGCTEEERGKVMSEESISWSELAELTHATQVERFGWCGCEDQGTLVYTDCPIKEEDNA